MRLKRLELHGFKSFADRTVMDFGDQQLTGIVGPNGCGKSNVVDAVRWVLGETRPTSMRGAGMTDVIFKGSASRPPMSVAEVTMVVDNESATIQSRGAEVSITRRLYKAGEGEYLIDGERVRLKDVRDMLFDTGLGSRGYSVLEQGRIDAVLSANPVQRRTIFEEAAGISRYRQRRHETELRLKRVEQDVSRLEDVMGELRTRVRSLKIQAGKAERYVAARAEWTEQRARHLRHRLARLDGELAELGPRLTRLEGEQEELRGLRGDGEGERRRGEQERSALVAELDRVATDAGRLASELSTLDERRSQLSLRVSSWRASALEEQERAAALAGQLAARREEQAGLARQLAQVEEALSEAEQAAGGVAARARELARTYRAARQAAEEQNETVLTRLHERTAAQNAQRHLEGAQGPAEQRLARARERLAQLDEVLARQRAEAEAAEGSAALAERALATSDEACEETRRVLAQAAASLATARERVRERELARAALRARIDSLLDREAELAALSEGTRGLLRAVASGAGPCAPEQLLGLLADHLSIDLRLARALDVALGDKAGRLVAADFPVALDLLEWMRAQEQGQVALVVPRGIGAPDWPTRGDHALFARYGMGVEGRLCDRVQCAEAMRPLAVALLGDVVVVSDLDLALELVGREPGWRFVTPAGDLVDASGVVGGQRELSHGAVGRRSTAADLAGEVDELERRLEVGREQAATLGQRVAELGTAADEAADGREVARRERADLAGVARAARARLADGRAARAELEREVQSARSEIAALESELILAGRTRASAEQAFEQDNARLEDLEVERRGLEERRETLAREESRAEVELTRLHGERQAYRRRLDDLARRVEEDEGEIARGEGRARNYEANAEQGDEEGEAITQQSALLAQRRAALEQRLEELRERERRGAQHIQEVRARAEEVQRALDVAGERLAQTRLDAQRLELSRTELLRRAHEELDLAPADLRAGFEPDPALADEQALEALGARVTELRERLEKIGPVNVDAVHELEQVAQRLIFLEGQAQDLANARRSLNDTIARIDGESRRLFLEAFEEIRTGFQRIFRQLFGGGRADVLLEDGVDVLEAGIEILARPPGREMLSIGLLSGGQRSMTALALLFAVFEARPSPFCVLDEVDAALDDANIDRFLGMLETFLSSCQFLVVTHNKGTMSACESLFGVTMQTKGVSSFVAVELDEVDEFAPGETTGKVRPRAAPPVDGEGPSPPDPLSGPGDEPIVELVPARARVDGTVEGGTLERVEGREERV